MKKKIICICIISIFLLTGLTSFSAVGININNGNENNNTSPTSRGITIDAGDIVIKSETSPETVECNPQDNFELEISESGTQVTVEVDYDIVCHEWFDEATVTIYLKSDTNIRDSKKISDNQKGKLSFSFTCQSSEPFEVVLQARYVDKTFWGEIIVDITDQEISYNGACSYLEYDVGEILLTTDTTGENPVKIIFNSDVPRNLEIGENGVYIIFNADFQNELYNSPHHDCNQVEIVLKRRDNPLGSITEVDRHTINDPPESGKLKVGGFFKPGEVALVHLWGAEYIQGATIGKGDFRNHYFYYETPLLSLKIDEAPGSQAKPYKSLEFKLSVRCNYNLPGSIYCSIDWGTGTHWGQDYRLVYVNETFTFSYYYEELGDYTITIKASWRGMETETYVHKLTISRSRTRAYNGLLDILERFPLLERLLNLL